MQPMQNSMDKNIALLCNVQAGTGRSIGVAEEIAVHLLKQKIPYVLFKGSWPQSLEGFTDIFIVGGDGTLNYFVNHYPGIQLPLVIFNGGTGNDFHWLLYGKQTLQEQLQLALHTTPRPIDLGKCNEKYFINGVGIGFEGEVARALKGKKKLPGKTSFLITILKKIFTYRSRSYTISLENQTITGKKLLVDISNGKRAGGGFYIAPTASADDGLFDVVIANALNAFQRMYYLPIIEKGKHLQLPFIKHLQSGKIFIESSLPIQFHLDGEYDEATRLDIEMMAGVLQFRY